ncbi:MAG: LysE family transporter [Coriobacteriia bacterium]|nr:LysE family transporter [Coriobacteriia bacterium]
MNAGVAAALSLGFSAFLIGLTGAMSPGPYLTTTITRTVTRGPRSAALMLVGHALLEGTLLLGFAFGLQNVLAAPTVHRALSVVGGGFLVWMAAGLLRGAVSGPLSAQSDTTAPVAESRLGSVLQGAAVSLSNPYWSLWWATIGVKLAIDGLAIGPAGVAAFFIGHQLADVTWYGLVIAATSRGRSLLTPGVYRTVIGACALFLLYLGARFVLEGFGVS